MPDPSAAVAPSPADDSSPISIPAEAVPRICIAPLGGATDAWRFTLYARGYYAHNDGCCRASRTPPAASPRDVWERARERSPPGSAGS